MRLIAAILLLFAVQSNAGTYYVDFSSGSDANNGTSTATPWKRAPGMGGGSMSYSASASDNFIFKGGVTWDKTCFPMWVPGTSAGHLMHYGVAADWYSGGSWTRPVFDAGSSVLGGGGGINRMVSYSNSVGFPGNIQFDNIEFAHYYWNSSQSYGSSIINCQLATNFIVSNCLFDKWSHDTYANGTRDNQTACVLGTSGSYIGNMMTNCYCDGSGSGYTSMGGCWGIEHITYCTATNMSNGFLPCGYPGEVDHCWIGPINYSFDPFNHENSIEAEANDDGNGTFYIHHNIINGASGAAILLGDVGRVFYVYDNVILNSIPVPIAFQGNIGNKTTPMIGYVWNNTLVVSSGSSVRSSDHACNMDVKNNHFIGGTGVENDAGALVTNAWNYTDATIASAAAEGYTIGNLFQPTATNSPTVGYGTNLFSAGVTNGLLGTARPSSGAFDAGAYQYSTNVQPQVPIYHLDVINGDGAGDYTSNSNPTVTAHLIGGQTFSRWTGNTNTMADPLAASTTITVNANYAVTANYTTNLPTVYTSPLQATNFRLTSPMVYSGNSFYQPVQSTDPTATGEATVLFTVSTTGDYTMLASVQPPSDSQNSFYVSINALPTEPTNVWDVYPFSGSFENVLVSQRGNGSDVTNQFNPAVWHLTAGVTNTLYVYGREAYTFLQSLTLVQTNVPAVYYPPQRLVIIPNQ